MAARTLSKQHGPEPINSQSQWGDRPTASTTDHPGDHVARRLARRLGPISGFEKLPPRLRPIILAGTLNAIGTGFTFPIVFIFLIRSVGLSTAQAGLSLGVVGASALGFGLAVPSVLERIPARLAFVAALLVQGLSMLGYLAVHGVRGAVVVGVALGMGQAVNVPAWNVILSTSEGESSSAFAVSNLTYNVGIGLGSLGVAGLLLLGMRIGADIAFVVDGSTYLIAALLILTADSPVGRLENARRDSSPSAVSRALHDRNLIATSAAMVALTVAAFGQVNTALPILIVSDGGLPSSVVGLAIAANTGVILFFQMLITNRTRHLSPTRLGGCAAAVFALAWLLVAVAARGGEFTGDTILFIVGMAVFGLAECLFAPSLSVIVGSLGPPSAAPSYYAIFGFATQAGQMAGPFVAGIGLSLGATYPLLLAATCVLTGVLIDNIPLPRAAE